MPKHMSQVLSGLALPILLSISLWHLPNQTDLLDVRGRGYFEDTGKTVLAIIDDLLAVVWKWSGAILEMLDVTEIVPRHFLKLVEAVVAAECQVHFVARVVLLVELLQLLKNIVDLK